MPQPAKVLGIADVRLLLCHVSTHRHAQRNHAIVLLSFKAGLRACEIAGLTWSMVVSANGRLSDIIHISGSIAKNGSPRRIPLHPVMRVTLARLRRAHGQLRDGLVIRSERGAHMPPPAAS